MSEGTSGFNAMNKLEGYVRERVRAQGQRKNQPEWTMNSASVVEQTIATARMMGESAFLERHDHALKICHRVLFELLMMRLQPIKSTADRDVELFTIQQVLTEQFLHSELALSRPISFPAEPEGFCDWWNSMLEPYVECPHEVFRYLESEASLAQYKLFLKQDLSVHVPYDDVIACLLVGTRGTAKRALYTNLSDEIGRDNNLQSHMSLLDALANYVEVRVRPDVDTMWEALACANVMMFLCQYRSLFPEAIGYLGCLEYLTPSRFRLLAAAGRRLNFPTQVLQFYLEHVDVDSNHASDWLNEIIVPVIHSTPEIIERVANGLCLRLHLSKVFWDKVLAQLRNSGA